MLNTPVRGLAATWRGADPPPMLDFELLQRELYTGVICDVLDSLGFREQAMAADVRPVLPRVTLVGRARPALSVDVYEILPDCYAKEIAWVDALQPGDVAVGCTNRSTRTGLWGELLSTAAQARGARGAVMDGYVRDVRRIADIGFPVFATGMRPVDSRGRSIVLDYDVAVVCAGVVVRPGDIVFGDVDGVAIIPQQVAEETVARALEKVRLENDSRADLQAGAYLRDVYAKHGVL